VHDNAFAQPVFRTDGFDEVDEETRGVAYIGGMAAAHDDAGIAGDYIRAADLLVEYALANDREHEIVLPALFLYRHALELRLKSLVRPAKLDHDLSVLVRELDARLLAGRGSGLPDHLVERVEELAKRDPRADAFRFTRTSKKGGQTRHFPEEILVDLRHLRAVVTWIDQEIERAGAELDSSASPPLVGGAATS
jgi:hypothetical protein